jgi:hypothetical protein
MAHFNYHDANGENEVNAEAYISVDKGRAVVSIMVHTGDGDGDSYTAYVPNHRAALLQLATEILEVLDSSDGIEEGYDGFGTNFAMATATSEADDYDKTGVVKWF